jgi:mono/diheme cytochrome c family protein
MVRVLAFAVALLNAGPCLAADSGAAIFAANCALCHGADGAGAPGVAPALAGTLAGYTQSQSGRQYLSQILMSGMVGAIQTQGHRFSGLMPSFSDRLSNEDAAAVLAYVLGHFNGAKTQIVAPADIAKARAANPSSNETHRLRLSLQAAK